MRFFIPVGAFQERDSAMVNERKNMEFTGANLLLVNSYVA